MRSASGSPSNAERVSCSSNSAARIRLRSSAVSPTEGCASTKRHGTHAGAQRRTASSVRAACVRVRLQLASERSPPRHARSVTLSGRGPAPIARSGARASADRRIYTYSSGGSVRSARPWQRRHLDTRRNRWRRGGFRVVDRLVCPHDDGREQATDQDEKCEPSQQHRVEAIAALSRLAQDSVPCSRVARVSIGCARAPV